MADDQSLLDYVREHDGQLPEPLRSELNKSCRAAFLKLRDRLQTERAEPTKEPNTNEQTE